MGIVFESENPNQFYKYREDDFIILKNKFDHFRKIFSKNTSTMFMSGQTEMVALKDFDLSTIRENILDLRSPEKKVFLFVPSGPYHMLIDFFGAIIDLYEKDPNLVFYINLSYQHSIIPSFNFDKNFINFMFKFFDYYNIKYNFIDSFAKIDYIIANNFYVLSNIFYGTTPFANKMLKYLKPFINNINLTPTKKVYISRKNHQDVPMIDTQLSIKQDIRIFNEEIIEEYLQKKGYEILVAENFNSFEEQLNYFYNTKVLISSTNAGLTNCVFMQKDTFLIEFISKLIIKHIDSDDFNKEWFVTTLNTLWQPICATTQINYLGISAENQDAQTIIKKIENNNLLKMIVTND